MSLSLYYNRISKKPLLTREEELDLFLEYSDPTTTEAQKLAIRERIIESSLRFVFRSAKRYSRGDPILFEELIAAGNDGLLVAFDKFTPERGLRFLSYAGSWVLQRILYHLSTQRIVALPIWRQQLSARIQKVLDKNPKMTFEELRAAFPDNTEKDLRELFGSRFLTFFIADISEGEDAPAFEINPIEDDVETRLDRDKFHKIISELKPEHQEIIELTYGIHSGEEMNVAAISAHLGISKEKVKQLKQAALAELKDLLGGINPFE